MKHWVIFLVLFSLSAKSQQRIPLDEKKYVDSLQAAASHGTPSARLDATLLLSRYYLTVEPSTSLIYLAKAEKLPAENSLDHARLAFQRALIAGEKDHGKAKLLLEKAIEYSQQSNRSEAVALQAAAWYQWAIFSMDREGYATVIKTLTEKCLPLARKMQDQKLLGHFLSQLGTVLTYNAEFAKGQQYLTEAATLLLAKAPKSVELVYNYINQTTNFCYQDKPTEAKAALDKAAALLAPYPDSQAQAFYQYGCAMHAITITKYDTALKHLDFGMKLAKKIGQKTLLQMLYFNKFDVLNKMDRPADAKKILTDVLQDKTLSREPINRKTLFQQLALLSESTGDVAGALQYTKQYAHLSDSLSAAHLALQVNELEIRYRTAEKEKKLAEKEAEIRRKDAWMLAIGVLCILLAALAYSTLMLIRSRRRLAEEKEKNHQRELEEITHRKELAVAKAVIDGEEAERARLAKDLHDGLGSLLTGIRMSFSAWALRQQPPVAGKDFQEIMSQLDNSVQELRCLSRNLMPEYLLMHGLETALKDLCAFYINNGTEVIFQPIGLQKNLPQSVQNNLYRIVQELLNNATKYAGAQHILVQCAQHGSHISLTVEDDGIGIDPLDLEKPESSGLRNIRNRTEYLKGDFDIQGKSGYGTTVNIEIDLDEN